MKNNWRGLFIFCISLLGLHFVFAQPPCGGYVGIHEGKKVYLCTGDTITLHGSGFMVEYPLVWSTGHEGSELEVTAPGIYSLRGHDYCGYDWIEVLPLDAAASPFTVYDTLCPGGKLPLKTLLTEASFSWTDGDTSHPREVSVPGLYSVEASTEGCGTLHFDFLVTLADTSTAWLPTLFICPGDTIEIPCICSSPDPWLWEYGCRWNDAFLWNSFDVTAPGVVKMEAQYPCKKVYYQQVVANPGCFTVAELEARSSLSNICQPQLPNAISPNGDGINEEFRDFSTCVYDEWDLQVYDLWGNRLFQSSDPRSAWEKSEEMAAGVYIWRLVYGVDGKKMGAAGTLTLMR